MKPTSFQRVVGGLGGLVLVGIGVLFLGMLGSSLAGALRLRLQPAIRFTVDDARIAPSRSAQGGFQLVIRFREPGRDGVEEAGLRKADYRDLAVLQRQLAPGTQVVGRRLTAGSPARLDLVEPGFTALLALPLLLLPAASVLAGGWMAWGSWTARSVPVRSGREPSPRLLLGAGLVFALTGTAVLAVTLVLPVARIRASEDWVPTPAVVEMSRSVSVRGSKGGRSWHPEVLYRYQSADGPRRASRIRFSGFWTHPETEDFLRRHPVGAGIHCLVDPRDPDQAVLERRLSPLQWIWLVFLPFPVAGAYMVRKAWRALGDRRRGAPGAPGTPVSGPS